MPVVDFHIHCYDEAIRTLPLSADSKERILGGNAARILRLA